jgi:ribosome-binding ATPase YchF (GTP1/OBG family)
MIDATSKPVLDIPKLSSELREAQIAEKEKDFLRQQQIASLYARDALEKSRLNTQRQVELENIKAWRDITQTQIEAQTRSAALTASLLTALQQPNVNFMNALSDAFNAGAAPFSARVRIRG